MEWILIYLAIKYEGNFYAIYNALKNKEFVPISELEPIRQALEEGQMHAITIVDDDYPENLKSINNPPFVLFYQGNINLLKKPAMMLTGEFSNMLIDKFIDQALNELVYQYVLVNGYFKPLDQRIIQQFLNLNGQMIVVLNQAIDQVNFDFIEGEQHQNLLILSEFPSGCHTNRQRIMQRNRLAIGLSEALIIASSYKKSGIMNLVTYALEQGKEIYCYPGLQTEEDGNNWLIQDGAHLITSIKAINSGEQKDDKQ